MRYLTFLLAIPGFAAITSITVESVSTTAVFRYNSGTSSSCTVAASLSSSLSPLLPQTDSTKFTGGLSDSQFSYLNVGENRVIILGGKLVKRGTIDGIPYSMALPVATTIFAQLTCGVATSAVLSFVTDAAVLGQSYVDPVQADPLNPGEVFNPWFDLSKRQWITDPQTGLQVQNLTLPHDISVCGAACSSFTFASGFVTANSPWTPTTGTYPYTITNNNTSYLALSAYGLHFWPPYPWGNPSDSYSSDDQGTLNWTQFVVTGSSSGSGDVLTACISENGVTCDPWGTVIAQNVPTSSGTMTFGTGSTQYQGGWINAGNRFRNAPETNPRTGNATCSGTLVTIDQFTNHLWTNGTPITINGVANTITAVTGDYTLTLNSSCTSGPYTANSLWWLFKMQSATAHTISISGITSTWEGGLGAVWPDGGFWGTNSLTSITGASSAPGYLVQIIGLGLYWFNSQSGSVALIGDSNLTGGGSNGNLCQGNSATWDTTGASSGAPVLYCNITGGSGILKMVYSGSFADAGNFDNNTPNQFCSSISPPCWTVTTITSSIDTLTTAFNSAYGTIGTNKGMTANNIVGINQHGELLIRAWTTDSTPGWLIMFDPNKIGTASGCVGGGQPGCVVAAIPTFAAQGANNQTLRAGPLKGSVMNNAGSGIISMGPFFWANNANNGGGPWQVGTTGGFSFSASAGSGVGQITTCPSNPFGVSGANCTAVPIDGQPYDPTPGPNETGARGEYVTIQPGDPFGVGGDNYTGGYEAVRVMVANTSSGTCGIYTAPCLWVQRAYNRDNLLCGPGSGIPGSVCGSPNLNPQASSVNVLLQYLPGASNTFWNYLADPNGTSLIQEFNFDSTGHAVGFNGTWIDCCSAQISYNNNGCQDGGGQCYGTKIDPSGNTYNLLTRYTPVFDGTALQNPPMNGAYVPISGNCSGGACGNATQIHPSSPGGGGSTTSNLYGQDSRPFNGFWYMGDEPCSATNVTGLLWVIAPGCQAGGGILHRKLFPTKAAWGWHPLLDISPTVMNGTSTYTFDYCVPIIAGDCYSGSVPGAIYFNVPWLSYPYSLFSGQATANSDIADITFVDNSATLDSVVEFPITNPTDRGYTSRTITHAFAPTKVNAPFFETQTTPGNEFWLFRTRQFVSSRNEALMVKRPPEIQDGQDRTWYASPSIPVSGYAGSYAILEWGYLDYGSDGVTHFNCTTRTQNCRSSASPTASNPFLFSAESQSPTNCAGGCSITPSFLRDRVVLWRVLRTDNLGNVLVTGSTQAMVVK